MNTAGNHCFTNKHMQSIVFFVIMIMIMIMRNYFELEYVHFVWPYWVIIIKVLIIFSKLLRTNKWQQCYLGVLCKRAY